MRAPYSSNDPAELLDASVIDDPHPFFARVRSENPVSRVGETGVHMVSSWDRILEVLDREEDFSAHITGVLVRDAQGQPSIFDLPANDGTQVIATADEPEHAVHRKLAKPRFAGSRIESLEPRIRAWAREALAPWLAAGGGDFVPVGERVPAKAVGHVLGLPEGDVERHRAWAMMGGEILAGDVNPAGLAEMASETARMAEYLGQHLQAAIVGEGGASESSLLQLLAGGVNGGQITRSEAAGIAIIMFGAGGESTSSLIGSAVRLLAENPDLAQRLRTETGLIPRFVEEVLRLEPPFKFHYRVIRRECELGGYALQPGDRLMLLWAAANRDPAVFSRPNALQLDRKHPKHHMSFGRGAHFCVGEQLARLETRVMLEEVLAGTTGFVLDSKRPPVYARSIFVRRLEKLPIVLA